MSTPSPHPPTDRVLDFMRLLWAVEHRLERTSKRMAGQLGVTGPQRLVLRIVERYPDISAGALANFAQLHPSTLTGILQRLEEKRLLHRQVDPEDSRRALLRIRDRARPLTAPVPGTVEEAITEVFRNLPKTTVRHAREVLAALAAALDDQTSDQRGRSSGTVPMTSRAGQKRRSG
jgi:DNA-binding MarR family transcriptional regulator